MVYTILASIVPFNAKQHMSAVFLTVKKNNTVAKHCFSFHCHIRFFQVFTQYMKNKGHVAAVTKLKHYICNKVN